MIIKADTHTHTIASTHAYSTLGEMFAAASKNGLEALAITDHGPALPDAPHEWHFGNMRVLPRYIDGVMLLKGAEANILDNEGSLDVPEYYMKHLDIVIASFHEPVFTSSTVEVHTEIWKKIARNPLVDIIGHCGSENYKFHYEEAIKVFAENDKIVELNNHSYLARPNSAVNCKEIALLCKKYGVKIVLSSDAHCAYGVGQVEKAIKLAEEVDYPMDLIMNTSAEKLVRFLESKKGRAII